RSSQTARMKTTGGNCGEGESSGNWYWRGIKDSRRSSHRAVIDNPGPACLAEVIRAPAIGATTSRECTRVSPASAYRLERKFDHSDASGCAVFGPTCCDGCGASFAGGY